MNAQLQGRYNTMLGLKPKERDDVYNCDIFFNYPPGDESYKGNDFHRCWWRSLLNNILATSAIFKLNNAKLYTHPKHTLLKRKGSFEMTHVLYACEQGQYLQYGNLLSTSGDFLDKFPGECFLFQSSKSGVYISRLFGEGTSKKMPKYEDETLFPPFTTWHVVAIYKKEKIEEDYPTIWTGNQKSDCNYVVVLEEKEEPKIHHFFYQDEDIEVRLVGMTGFKDQPISDPLKLKTQDYYQCAKPQIV